MKLNIAEPREDRVIPWLYSFLIGFKLIRNWSMEPTNQIRSLNSADSSINDHNRGNDSSDDNTHDSTHGSG